MLAHIVIDVMRDHLAVLNAMVRRDVAGAVAAMTAHISNAHDGRWDCNNTPREDRMTQLNKRSFLKVTAGAGALVFAPHVARAQATVIRWGEMLPPTHPQVQMIDKIAAEVKEKTGGRIEIQSFPNGQLGSGKDMMNSVAPAPWR